MSLTSGIQLAPLAVEIIGDASKLMTTIDKSTTAATNKAEIAGKRLTSIGAKMTVGITAPIATAATALGGMAVSFESNFAKVSTLLDSSTVDYNQYKESIIEGSNKMKTSVADYSEAVYQSISAGVDQSKAIEFTNNAIKLAKGGFTDAASAVDILTTVINAYSLSTDEATRVSDLLVNTQNLGKTTVNELASAMGRVIPTAKNAGVNIDNVCTAMAVMTKNGIATAEATTYYNSMLNELASSGTTADKTLRELSGTGFAGLMQQGKGVTEILSMLQGEAQKSGQSLGDMFGSSEAAKAALTIMKNDGTEYNDILNQMATSAGATEEAFKKIDSTPAERLAGAWNKLKNSGIELGDSLIPLIEKGADAVSDLADWLGSLSEEEQESILKTAGFVAAMGPVLTVTGKGISTISSLTKTFKGLGTTIDIAKGTSSTGIIGTVSTLSKLKTVIGVAGPSVAYLGTMYKLLKTHTDLANSSIDYTTDEMGMLEKTMNALGGGFHKSNKELEEMGIKYKSFNEGVSKKFQTQVEESAEQVRNLNQALHETTLDGVITEEETASINTKVEKMCQDAISTIQSYEDPGKQALLKAFSADGAITESEQATLDAFSKTYDDAINVINEKGAQIQELAKQRNSENAVEIDKQINQLAKEIQETRLQSIATSQEEINAIHTNFVERASSYDKEAASKVLVEKKKNLDEQNKLVHENYDEAIKFLEEQIEKTTGIEQEGYKAQLEEQKRQREEQLRVNRESYTQFYKELEEVNPKVAEHINMITGKTMNETQTKNQNMLKKMISTHKEMANVTESGYYEMYNSTTKNMDKIAIYVDEKTGQIAAAWNESEDIQGECMDKTIIKAKKVASTMTLTSATSADQWEYLKGATVTATGDIINAQGNLIGTMDKVKMKNGEVKSGIIELNGTPVEVKVNKDGTIANIDEIIKKTNSVDKNPTITFHIKQVGKLALEGLTAGLNAAGFHYNGLESVPYDGYTARLHKDERVLTAKEAENYSRVINNNNPIINFNGNYNFNDKSDIDYFMNQAALKIKGARG